MDQSPHSITPYLRGALIVSMAFLLGFFAPRLWAEYGEDKTQVSVIGPITNQNNINTVVKEMEKIIGKGAKIKVQQQTQGDAGLQFVVALDGTIASLESDELKQFGYLVTVDEGKNPYKSDLLNAEESPNQYYALFEEDLLGKINLVSLDKIHY
jgi:hypothetical protein